MNDRMIPMTDDKGRTIAHPDDAAIEPLPGSIALSEGMYGTAWQRHFNDGLWHSTRGSATATWSEMLTKRNLVLVYDADEREQLLRPARTRKVGV